MCLRISDKGESAINIGGEPEISADMETEAAYGYYEVICSESQYSYLYDLYSRQACRNKREILC